ncbi:uncharacterized protein LTR77_001709 [Saxophila tyrrhenica]|uniref:TEL2-interacting protein 1 n=1 Tax=Saxophila tyrrhenica TaxID=1690608 RepID=A0AAV9PL69_9PEZI|nr:hypothetical protein LTR77_001709 [Saxophila tyrrhenica]
MEGKNELFQRLKQDCVALAQAAASYKSGRTDQKTLVDRLEKLEHTVTSATSSQGNVFDAKLAEYVFFPIAQLLRESKTLSIRCLEISLQCIATLVDKGWKQDIPPQLAAQLVILCSNLGDKSPKGLSFSETTDELQTSSFWCLYHVFTGLAKSNEGRKTLTDDLAFPQLGQTISVLLDGVQDGKSMEPQVAGSAALKALVADVIDAEAQANFLPGLVSRLTKILTPQTKQRRNHKTLIDCLGVLGVLLKNTVGDEKRLSSEDSLAASSREATVTSAQWKDAAATQIKPAISNILRLKSHARDDVKESLAQLCTVLLRHCRRTLENCSELALDALVTMASGWEDSAITSDLRSSLRSDRSIVGLLQSMLYERLRKLALVMQGHDEDIKAATTSYITTMYTLLVEVEADMTTIDRTLMLALRDSAALTIAPQSRKQELAMPASPIQAVGLDVLKVQTKDFSFASQLARYRGQETNLNRLDSIMRVVAKYSASSSLVTEVTKDLRYSVGNMQIANLWLLLLSTEVAVKEAHAPDNFLQFEEEGPAAYGESLEELYAFSLSTLAESSDQPQDPRLLSLALRGLALRAQTAGQDFRYELVDALYPVLHTLATPDDQLQRDSISTLDAFTSACGYASTRDLIVENVDYLTNAVALKLNAFDVSSQAPQVLLMMVRLAGQGLLPYLEDTVESMFAALEDYHGYPLLVELLFKVLSAMAEEGAKAPQLAITYDQSKGPETVETDGWQPITMEGLVALLRGDANEDEDLPSAEPLESHPQRPWKVVEDNPEDAEADAEKEEDALLEPHDEADLPPPAPKTYNLLFKITELTQHFLPSASPSLRTSLLSLIKVTVPAIARHENSFLPLINTLWPEIVARLDDEEPFAVASAIDVIGVLCEYAGDFMRSRIDQVWPRLMELWQATTKKGLPKQKSATASLDIIQRHDKPSSHLSHSHHGDTSSRMIREALESTMTRIVHFLQTSPEMFDEALLVLQNALDHTNTRQALMQSNADALWLTDVKRGRTDQPDMPPVPDARPWEFAQLPSVASRDNTSYRLRCIINGDVKTASSDKP